MSILVSVASVATPTPATGPADTMVYPSISAHRGGGMLYPEETLTALNATRANHPHMMLEFDVQALKDGTLVLAHDKTVDRTAAGGVTGAVKDMTVSQWNALQIKHPQGGPPAPASTLDQVMAELGGTDTVLVPELKDYAAADKFIETLWPYRAQIFVQAGNQAVLTRLAKSGFRALQVTSVPMTVDLAPGIYGACVRHTVLDQATIDYLHGKGLTVWAWTVNDQPRINELIGMGVDAIMTDDPGLSVDKLE